MAVHLNKLILKVCEPGEYYGREAHRKLNQLADEIHKRIINICSSVSKVELLKELYSNFEQACHFVVSLEHWLYLPSDVISKLQKGPSVFRYLVEAALYADSQSDGKVTKDLIVLLVEAANLFLEVCNFSDYLYYGGFSGGFRVMENGDIEFVKNQTIKKVEKRYLNMMAKRMQNIVVKVLKDRTNVNHSREKSYFGDLVKPYEKAFKERYGVSLSTVAKIIERLFSNYYTFPPKPILIPYSHLITRLAKDVAVHKRAIKDALSLFELSKEMLLEEWKYYKFHDVQLSLSRRSIVRLSGKIGKKGLILFGSNALLRAFVLLLNDLDRGVIDLGHLTNEMQTKRGYTFEKRIREEILPAYGFRALRLTETPSGEIDAVASNESTGIVLVVDAKSRKADASAKSIARQLERTEKWCKEHQKKVNWVKKSLDQVLNRLGLNEAKVNQVVGVIVLEIPVYVDPEVEEKTSVKVMTVEQFELFLGSLQHSSSYAE